MENNRIIVSGQIIKEPEFSHSYGNENFYKAVIECYRTSGIADYINVILSDRIIATDLLNKYICVDGSIRTKNIDGHLVTIVFADGIDVMNDVNVDDRIDINNVALTGFICRKNQLRSTPFNRTICDYILAVNRNYGKSDYIPQVSWGRTAKYVNDLPIGTKVNTYGRLQSRTYEKNDCVFTTYEVSVQEINVENNE